MIQEVVQAIKSILDPPIEYRNYQDVRECAIDETIVKRQEMDIDPS